MKGLLGQASPPTFAPHGLEQGMILPQSMVEELEKLAQCGTLVGLNALLPTDGHAALHGAEAVMVFLTLIRRIYHATCTRDQWTDPRFLCN